ncbi:MAG: 30S ribosomal protein S20 [Gammaproteobacteria bacterium]|nr:30S ribosomal protein S20 [Gammaproteobacteria bacterium]
MANTAQARKRVRQATKRREHNVALRSRMRTYVKRVIAAINAKDKDQATSAFREMSKMVDSAAGKGLIHANKAARHKSRLNARIKAL